jgi:hypothetical protein
MQPPETLLACPYVGLQDINSQPMATRRERLLLATKALEGRLQDGSTAVHVDDHESDHHSVRENQRLAPFTSDTGSSDYSDAESLSPSEDEDDSSSQPSESTTTTTDSGQKTHLALWAKRKSPFLPTEPDLIPLQEQL